MKTAKDISNKIVSKMIRNAFLDIEDEAWTDDEEYYQLIDTAHNFGLHDLANELLHLLPHAHQKNEYLNRIYTKTA